jgi:hypothetical protein
MDLRSSYGFHGTKYKLRHEYLEGQESSFDASLLSSRWYDLQHLGDEEDIAFYLGLVRRLLPPSAFLELGCVTARITLPLAETGMFKQSALARALVRTVASTVLEGWQKTSSDR